ncbi:MAG: hypothetical protein LBG93_03545 [Treponema sp.]|jgi:hypothetical protein|nr:hypothetical protein [Treponema sp.]
MKKLLITLLALAVAGGSAFAQGWTFNGAVFGGVGMFFDEAPTDGDREMRIAPMTGFQTNGFRTQLDTRFVNADGTAGLTFRILSNNPVLGDVILDHGFGWLSFQNDAIRLYGGRLDNGFFNTQDRMTGQDLGEGMGLLTIVRPVDNFWLGVGAYSSGTGQEIPGGAADGPRATVGLRFDLPDVLRITAQWRNASSAGGAIGGMGAGALLTGVAGPETSQAYVSVGLLGIADVHAALTARMINIEDFADSGEMLFYVTLGHTGLVDGLDLRLGASFGMSMVEDTSHHLWLWFGLDYQVTANVVPRLNLHFVQGGVWALPQSTHHWAVRNGFTFNEDHSFINVMPSVQVRVSPSAFMELGGFIHSDLGDAGTRGLLHNGLNAGVFALMQVAF